MTIPLNSVLNAVDKAQMDPEDVFNLVVEYAVPIMAEKWKQDLESEDYLDESVESVEQWLTGGRGMGDHIPEIIAEFDVDVWVDIVDGQIENRGLEAITDSKHNTFKTEIRYEAEIALRNEVAYRLIDRGYLPSCGWSERYDVDD